MKKVSGTVFLRPANQARCLLRAESLHHTISLLNRALQQSPFREHALEERLHGTSKLFAAVFVEREGLRLRDFRFKLLCGRLVERLYLLFNFRETARLKIHACALRQINAAVAAYERIEAQLHHGRRSG